MENSSCGVRTYSGGRSIKIAVLVISVVLAVQMIYPVNSVAHASPGADQGLFKILTRQYDFTAKGLARDIAYMRYETAMRAIERNMGSIKAAGEEFGVPPEMIAAVILKEQFTRSAPDQLVVLMAPIRHGEGSTGLGAVTADTAKKAYDYFGCSYELPADDQGILRLFCEDEGAAVEATACVLAYEAAKYGFGRDGDFYDMTKDEWHKVFYKYNGAHMYADKTIQYVPEFEKLF